MKFIEFPITLDSEMKEKYLFVEVINFYEPILLIANPYPLYGKIDNIFDTDDATIDYNGSFCILKNYLILS